MRANSRFIAVQRATAIAAVVQQGFAFSMRRIVFRFKGLLSRRQLRP